MQRSLGGLFQIAMLVLLVMCSAANAQEVRRPRCGADVHLDDRTGVIPLPQGEIFCPFVADPKWEHSFLSYFRGDFATIANPVGDADTNLASVGLGDHFGIVRVAMKSPGEGLQLDLTGAIFAQFNLDEPSFDLINADYIIALPLTFRARGFSARFRLYHQSSHLGDEFLLANNPERENLSFEALDLMFSGEIGALRIYGGGETFFGRQPKIQIVARLAHAGAELRPATFGAGRLVFAVDVKAVDQTDWVMSVSARAGVEIARVPSPGHPARVVSLLAEYYDGSAPYGQFYRDNISFFGLGLHFGL
jgi:Protein of unknown function (DUF1207)